MADQKGESLDTASSLADLFLYGWNATDDLKVPASLLGNATIDIRGFGATTGALAATNVAATQAAIAYATSIASRVVRVDGGTYDLTGIDQTVYDVVLVGTGSITGVYRQEVIPETARSNWLPSDTLAPSKHLANSLAAAEPRFVMLGDSISTPYVAGEPFTDESDRGDSMNELLQGALMRAFPNAVYFNRSISGTSFGGFTATSNLVSSVEWNTLSQSWLQYIVDLKPTAVFVAFGMNDGASFVAGTHNAGYILQALAQLRSALGPACDVVLCTNILPSTTTSHVDYNPIKSHQEARDAMAGLTRSVAEFLGLGYIDFNQYMNVVRDGRDVLDTTLEVVDSGTTQTMPYLPTRECRDFVIRAQFASIGATFWSAGQLAIPLGPSAGGNTAWIQDDGGKLKLTLFCSQSGTLRYLAKLSDIETPATGDDVDLYVSLVRNHLKITINDEVLYDGPCIRYGGVFAPRIWYSGVVTAGPTGTFKFLAGRHAIVRPSVRDRQMFTRIDGTTHPVHPGPVGHRAVFAPMINRQGWQAEGRPPVEPAGAAAQRLLMGNQGLAIDFTRRDYIIRDLTTPAHNAQGDPISILTNVAGTVAYEVDSATGRTKGLLVNGSNYAKIDLTTLPFSATEGALWFEALLKTGTGSWPVIIKRTGSLGPRIQFAFSTLANVTVSVIDDASASVAGSLEGSNAPGLNQFVRAGLAWSANHFEFVTRGGLTPNAAVDSGGAIPTSLAELLLGYSGSANMLISRLSYTPKRVDPMLLSRRVL